MHGETILSGLEIMQGFLLCFFFGFTVHCRFVSGITPFEPSFISAWISAKAQDDNKVEFFVPFPDLGNRPQDPVKVIVEVKVTDGSDFYIFNAFGSAPRDDDVNEKYGGVIYFYNTTGVLILLAEKYEYDQDNLKESSGKAVYLGNPNSWIHPTSYAGGTIKEEYDDVHVRVKMWLQRDLPPDYDSGFIYTLQSTAVSTSINVLNNAGVLSTYLEIPMNISSFPDMVVVQAKPTDPFEDFMGLISEGNGMPACLGCGKQAGGLAFGYNETHVRLWVKKDYPITSASDGWGYRKHEDRGRLISSEVNVRILAWKFSNAPNRCRWSEESSTPINDGSTVAPKMLFRQQRDIDASLAIVSIRPSQGTNSGFVFYGSGSVVTSGDYDTSDEIYSGVVFGYNEHGVFVWRVRPSARSAAFLISSPWGGGEQSQRTNEVMIDMQVFGLMARGACNTSDLALTNARLDIPLVKPCHNADISCNYGYEPTNDTYNRMHCHLDAVWDTYIPQCKQIFCPEEVGPSYGTVLYQNLTVDGILEYACDPGFNVSAGNLSRTCLSNGTWSGQPPNCSEILCPTIEVPENVILIQYSSAWGTFNHVNSTVYFSCEPGFLLSADVSLICLITGEWSAEPPVCSEILCPNVTDPTDGAILQINNKVNGTLTYTCNENYHVTSGNLSRVCSNNGSWSGDPPVCSEIFCPEIRDPQNGNVTFSSDPSALAHSVGATATFSCLSGFALSSDATLTCLATGNWSAATPICSEIILCPNVTDPSNGTVEKIDNRVNGTLTYLCNPNYHVTSGSLQRVCLNNGSWSGDPPVCSELLCPQIVGPDNGEVKIKSPNDANSVNVTAFFICLPGFSLSENVSLTCLVTGNWSAAPPVCSEILCPNVTDPTNGTVQRVNNKVNGTLTYTCNDNYHVTSGNLSRVCLNNGSWSGYPPVCSEILCPPFTIPANTVVSFSPDVPSAKTDGLPVDTCANFTCKPGFRLNVSTSTIYCRQDGSWTQTPPGCDEIFCPDPEIPPNSTLTDINKSVNGTAQFVCNKGYLHTKGSLQRKCLESGEWEGTATVCTASGSCMCPCQFVTVPKYTDVNDKALIKEIENIQKELKVVRNKTSAALRKKISVKDFRPSTNVSGAVWMIFLLCLVGFIVVPDVISAFRNIVHYFHSKSHNCNKRFQNG